MAPPVISNVLIIDDMPTEKLVEGCDFVKTLEDRIEGFGDVEKFLILAKENKIKVTYRTAEGAMVAKKFLDGKLLHEIRIKISFAEFEEIKKPANLPQYEPRVMDYLQLPINDKLILISPPSSPPVGWESQEEAPPVLNHDLVQAMQKLGGAPLLLHEHDDENVPSIVVTGINGENNNNNTTKPILSDFPKAKIDSLTDSPKPRPSLTLGLNPSNPSLRLKGTTGASNRSTIPQTIFPGHKK